MMRPTHAMANDRKRSQAGRNNSSDRMRRRNKGFSQAQENHLRAVACANCLGKGRASKTKKKQEARSNCVIKGLVRRASHQYLGIA